jgi:hypothetical protein
MISVSIHEWIKHPKGFVVSTIKGAYTTTIRTPIGSAPAAITGAATLMLFGLAVGGILLIRKRKDMAIFLGGTIGYLLVTNIFAFGGGDARMRIPITPHVVILALFCVEAYTGRLRNKIVG